MENWTFGFVSNDWYTFKSSIIEVRAGLNAKRMNGLDNILLNTFFLQVSRRETATHRPLQITVSTCGLGDWYQHAAEECGIVTPLCYSILVQRCDTYFSLGLYLWKNMPICIAKRTDTVYIIFYVQNVVCPRHHCMPSHQSCTITSDRSCPPACCCISYPPSLGC